jgi:site-specific DNA-methyltransferase (adenine-specific)
METCSKCYGDIKDYGGYKDKMNPNGINITDVWYDIPPVRHAKNKGRKDANELSIKLLDRIIEMASNPGDLIFDPFGGSGTSYIVSELKERRWIGIELGPIEDIIKRFKNLKVEKQYLLNFRDNYNKLFPTKLREKRIKNGLWTDETVREKKVKKVERDLFSDTD